MYLKILLIYSFFLLSCGALVAPNPIGTNSITSKLAPNKKVDIAATYDGTVCPMAYIVKSGKITLRVNDKIDIGVQPYQITYPIYDEIYSGVLGKGSEVNIKYLVKPNIFAYASSGYEYTPIVEMVKSSVGINSFFDTPISKNSKWIYGVALGSFLYYSHPYNTNYLFLYYKYIGVVYAENLYVYERTLAPSFGFTNTTQMSLNYNHFIKLSLQFNMGLATSKHGLGGSMGAGSTISASF